ncbi:YitT family protein [Mediterraneibacter glycyrrhizinilyticus]|uniref:YitT family protein n=1 Tax=Mediterraneibacter glycyrrhizinilyticus TaxID=342942 RepID=UPI0036F38D23
MTVESKKELRSIFNLKKIFFVLLGNTIYCAGIVAFVLPTGLVAGGTTGLGLIVNHYFGVPIELFAAIFNTVMFLLAVVLLGKAFALTSLISTFYFPVILGVFQKIEWLQDLTDDPMLCTVFAAVSIGVGIGMVIKAGASTGGMDIPPLILNKKMGVPVSVGLYTFDFLILIGQMFFRDTEKSLYGILLVMIYTVLVDKVLLMGKNQMQVKIMSERYEEINEMIHQKLDRGTTLYRTESGYLHNKGFLVMTVVSNRELPKLNQLIMEIDDKAFMVISQVSEVKGRGFTLHKHLL